MIGFGRRREPLPPENVRLVLMDGSELAVDCVFAGTDAEGVAIWQVVTDLPEGASVVQMKADMLPAKTSISFPFRSVTE